MTKTSSPRSSEQRPRVHGRSILLGSRKLHVRGATYGTFEPTQGSLFPPPATVRRDLEAMAASGLNAFRTYTVPPLWMLDTSAELGLRVMVGIPWEQHVAFLSERRRTASIEERVRSAVRACSGHPAVLCYAIGNEIPSPIVRWHGARRIERFLERLCNAARDEDPEGLVTYVNYPTTEYLELPFVDVVSFNVFLETEQAFASYLARLQNLASDRPLLITEAGLDSRRNGEILQARTLAWQVRHAFASGAAGVFVFAWTDEWHRGGSEVTDWGFGLVDRDRAPKGSLAAIEGSFRELPFPRSREWPSVSVVICTYNGEETLGECLAAVSRLDYPAFEVIVVDDGSTDRTADIARAHDCQLIRQSRKGLGAARNAGVERASGEIVAFLDDDAYPDPDWLPYLAARFAEGSPAAVGGPNLPPPDEGFVAACVAAAPGAPVHVLINDREAEHVPGCNMAFRRSALLETGGFDEQFRIAGDDVDICWRLQDTEHSLGFSAGAVVMHRRRNSVTRYLRQQYEYGKAEAALERKWPSRYNPAGHFNWSGRIYAGPSADPRRRQSRIHYGTWGSGLFQSVYEPAESTWSALALMPEWFLGLAALAAVSLLGLAWAPLLVALVPLALGIALTLRKAVSQGWRAHGNLGPGPRRQRWRRRALTSLLHLLQPLARLAGRLRGGLSPWRRRAPWHLGSPLPRRREAWSESWRSPEAWLGQLETNLTAAGTAVRRGGPFDRWDLEQRPGPFGIVRIQTALEEHGRGRQLMRMRAGPRLAPTAMFVAVTLAAIAAAATVAGDGAAATVAGGLLAGILLAAAADLATGLDLAERALEQVEATAPAVEAAPEFAPLPVSVRRLRRRRFAPPVEAPDGVEQPARAGEEAPP